VGVGQETPGEGEVVVRVLRERTCMITQRFECVPNFTFGSRRRLGDKLTARSGLSSLHPRKWG